LELFKEPLEHLRAYLEAADRCNRLHRYTYKSSLAWPLQTSLVLQEDTAVELGGAGGSLFLILWTAQEELIRPDCISLVGPDLTETSRVKLPFTQVILVRGGHRNEYETYQTLLDTVLATRLEGISIRIWPNRCRIWCRVNRAALGRNFNLRRYGYTLLKRLKTLPSVQEAEIIFVTEAVHQGTLPATAATKVQETLEVLLKIYEDLNFDCESCAYKEVCAEVTGLREIHRRLNKERKQV